MFAIRAMPLRVAMMRHHATYYAVTYVIAFATPSTRDTSACFAGFHKSMPIACAVVGMPLRLMMFYYIIARCWRAIR